MSKQNSKHKHLERDGVRKRDIWKDENTVRGREIDKQIENEKKARTRERKRENESVTDEKRYRERQPDRKK